MSANVTIFCKGMDLGDAIKLFGKAVTQSGLLHEMKSKMSYEKPSVRKRQKSNRARRRLHKSGQNEKRQASI